jgi:Tfp pilus assembly protein PilO
MSHLSKDQKNKLVLIGVITLMVSAALWTLIVSDQRQTISNLGEKTEKIREKIDNAERAAKTRQTIEQRLQEREELMAVKEEQMAPEDDPYAWMLDKINAFKESRQVGDVFLDKPDAKNLDVGVLPAFSYKAAVFHFSGTGTYGAIGRFIADFENDFRLFQIRNVAIRVEPIKSGRLPTNTQSLRVDFDIVALLRSSKAGRAK